MDVGWNKQIMLNFVFFYYNFFFFFPCVLFMGSFRCPANSTHSILALLALFVAALELAATSRRQMTTINCLKHRSWLRQRCRHHETLWAAKDAFVAERWLDCRGGFTIGGAGVVVIVVVVVGRSIMEVGLIMLGFMFCRWRWREMVNKEILECI